MVLVLVHHDALVKKINSDNMGPDICTVSDTPFFFCSNLVLGVVGWLKAVVCADLEGFVGYHFCD